MKYIITVFIIICFIKLSFAQDTPKTENGYTLSKPDKNYGELAIVHSDTMNIDLPVLVFLPKGYKKSKTPFKVVYLLHGANNRPKTEEGVRTIYNPGTKTQEMADIFNVIIVTPITGPSSYLDSPIKPTHRYATYVGVELPKYIDANYNTVKSRDGRILAGFSMGGYGAVSLYCRFPDTFSVALSRAGALNPATWVEDLYWDDVHKGAKELLGNYWESREHYHKNNCFNLINHIRHRDDVALVIEVGQEDFLYKTNSQFHEHLKDLGIPHIYGEYPGGHKWGVSQLESLLTHLQYFNQTQNLEK